eukprot:359654-Chlamydomonas_euryale.AAC.2
MASYWFCEHHDFELRGRLLLACVSKHNAHSLRENKVPTDIVLAPLRYHIMHAIHGVVMRFAV